MAARFSRVRMHMNEALPSAIENYFSGKNARDFALAASGFSSSAVVPPAGSKVIGKEKFAGTAAVAG